MKIVKLTHGTGKEHEFSLVFDINATLRPGADDYYENEAKTIYRLFHKNIPSGTMYHLRKMFKKS